MQQHPVNLARPLNTFKQVPTKIIKGLATHRATGNGTAKDRPDEFEACSSAASMNAASIVFVPRKRRGIASPCAIPCLANSSIVVGIFEKVLVSCENVPVTMRI